MPIIGRIEQWNDAKGYGFVRALESQARGDDARAFVHIKAIERAGRRPAEGDLIRYETRRDAQGRLNAVDVAFVNASAMRAQAEARSATKASARERRAGGRRIGALRRAITAAATAVLAGGWLLGLWPGLVPLLYAAMSLVSFLAYRHDKVAAERGRWRTPESTLHLLDLAGGWPGGLLAQQVFRHKSSKTGYQVVFWLTVALNGIALVLLARAGWFDMLQQSLLAG